MRALLVGAAVLAAFAYPFLTHWLAVHGWIGAVLALCALFSLRRAWSAKGCMREFHGLTALVLATTAWLAQDLAARLVPAFVYLSLALLFGQTLVNPPSLLERMVRLQFPVFEPGVGEYLRRLTGLWTGFFILSAALTVALARWDEQWWTLYTGVVFYLLMGLLTAGEYVYRRRRFPHLEAPNPLASLRVMARDGRRVMEELRR